MDGQRPHALHWPMAYEGPEPREVDRGVWEIPAHGAMGVAARIFATRRMMPSILRDGALRQVCNVACLACAVARFRPLAVVKG